MDINALIKKMKDNYSPLMNFIEATDDVDAEFKELIEILDRKEILQKQEEVRLLFQLISKIADNHNRTSDFFDKIEKIFQSLIKDPCLPISYLHNYVEYNKRLFFLLFIV